MLGADLEGAVVDVLGEFLQGLVELVLGGVELSKIPVQLASYGVAAVGVLQYAPVGEAAASVKMCLGKLDAVATKEHSGKLCL